MSEGILTKKMFLLNTPDSFSVVDFAHTPAFTRTLRTYCACANIRVEQLGGLDKRE